MSEWLKEMFERDEAGLPPLAEHKVCDACQRGRHDQCSGQVSTAKMPCDCRTCWGSHAVETPHEEACRLMDGD